MSERIQQPRTWIIVGLLALLALGVYLAATSNRGQATLAANVEETTADVAVAEPLIAGSAVTILTEDDRPGRLKSATSTWNTNWNRHTIDYNELLSGGPPRDGIPSIDDPSIAPPGTHSLTVMSPTDFDWPRPHDRFYQSEEYYKIKEELKIARPGSAFGNFGGTCCGKKPPSAPWVLPFLSAPPMTIFSSSMAPGWKAALT